MRSLLALFLSWLMPAQGKRRRTAHTAFVPTQRLTLTRNTITGSSSSVGVGFPSHRSPRPPASLCGEDVGLIRPYLVAHERAQGIDHQGAVT